MAKADGDEGDEKHRTNGEQHGTGAHAAGRSPAGREVLDSRHGGRGRRRESEPAGVDVGDEDGPGAELVQVVHDPLGLLAEHHRADRDPALVVQRRDGRRLEARGQRDGLARRARPGCRSPSARSGGRRGRPAAGAGTARPRGRPGRRPVRPDQHRLGGPGSARRRSPARRCAAWYRSPRRRR